MTKPTNLQGVLEGDLCIACGACVLADPSISLKLHPEKLIFEPDHAGGAEAAAVCPAVAVDFEGLQTRLFPGAEAGVYGVVHSVMLAQSCDQQRNERASSGGIIKELLIELLGRDDVDGAIVLQHVEGLDFRPGLIRKPAEVDGLPGSIYHNLPKHEVLELLRANEGRFVVVAIPCELEGLYNYIFAVEPQLLERVHTTIGLLCGWQYNWHSIRAICEYKGIDPDTIVDISYRGGGPVGKLRIWTSDDTEHVINRRVGFAYQVAFDRTFNTPRCHLCINHSNFLADIVVGDAWLASTLATKTGISLVINRRPESDELVRKMAAAGRVTFSEVTVNEIRESQKPAVAHGDFAYAYAAYRREAGLPTPDMVGPNRPAANLAGRAEVAGFHAELVRKTKLQRQRRYRYLFWRKATREFRRFESRYWQWFRHRVLRVGRDPNAERTVAKQELARFR